MRSAGWRFHQRHTFLAPSSWDAVIFCSLKTGHKGFACGLQFPLGKKLAGIFEPTVEATIITPTPHVGAIMQLAQGRRGEMTEHALLGPERTLLK